MHEGFQRVRWVSLNTSEDPETMIQSIRDSRRRLALSRIREESARNETDRLSLDENNREIIATRKERQTSGR